MPWRKGPWSLYGVNIDTEWRSDWKWERVLPHLSDLTGRTILDVGCGSGYHMWRMIGAGARLAVGIDPTQLFLCQFEAVRKLLGNDQRAHLLPLGIEQLPALNAFDTVFSMGVLYHRRSPLDHLWQLKDQLVPGAAPHRVDDHRVAGRLPRSAGQQQNPRRLPCPAARGAYCHQTGNRTVAGGEKAGRQTAWLTRFQDKKRPLFNGQGPGTGNHHIGRHDVQQKTV